MPNLERSGREGRQNARRRVRFDKIFASFSSPPAAGREWKSKGRSGLRIEKLAKSGIFIVYRTFAPDTFSISDNDLRMTL